MKRPTKPADLSDNMYKRSKKYPNDSRDPLSGPHSKNAENIAKAPRSIQCQSGTSLLRISCKVADIITNIVTEMAMIGAYMTNDAQ